MKTSKNKWDILLKYSPQNLNLRAREGTYRCARMREGGAAGKGGLREEGHGSCFVVNKAKLNTMRFVILVLGGVDFHLET